MSRSAWLPTDENNIAEISPVKAADAVSQLLRAIGEDPLREGLAKTPERVARAMADLTAGYRMSPREAVGDAVYHEAYEGVVLVKDIEFYSLCEHHLLPFFGRAHIAYLPAGKVVGLSKLPRVLDVFARRLQVQERITREVADALEDILQPRGLAVMLDAAHFCMMMRGVEKQGSRTSTLEVRGAFRDPARRSEFVAAVGAPTERSWSR
jgi:GTP cyclohydrolase I